MKREEAEQIWSMIAATYDIHPERAGEQAVIWVPALEGHDAMVVMSIIDGYMKGRGPEKLPTVVSFMADVSAIEKRLAEDERRTRKPLSTPRPPMPEWVHEWMRRRAAGDMTPMPEQQP